MNSPNFVSPDPEHAPEWDDDRSDIRDSELYQCAMLSDVLSALATSTHHCLCIDSPASLNAPETPSSHNGWNSLGKSQVGALDERKIHLVVLHH